MLLHEATINLSVKFHSNQSFVIVFGKLSEFKRFSLDTLAAIGFSINQFLHRQKSGSGYFQLFRF